MASISIAISWFCFISERAVFKMLSVFNPRKSIFITPASSIEPPSICVSQSSDSFEVATGNKSVKSFGAMMMADAWIPVFLTDPSRISASCNILLCKVSPAYRSRNFFTFSISSPCNCSFSSKDFSPFFASLVVKGACNKRFKFIPGRSGTSFEIALLSAIGKSITLATSAILDLAAIVP